MQVLGGQRSGFWVSISVLHWTKNIVNFSSRTHTFMFYRRQFSQIVVDCCQNRLYIIAHNFMDVLRGLSKQRWQVSTMI